MRFGSRGPSDFFSQIRHRNALTEIAWKDAAQGLGHDVYRSVIEKQGIVAGIAVYRQRILQTVASLPLIVIFPFKQNVPFCTSLVTFRVQKLLHFG